MNLDDSKEELEELAVSTLKEVMANTSYSPEIRITAAEKALRTLGKDQVQRQSGGNQLTIVQFSEHAMKSLQGIQKVFELQEPRRVTDES